MTSTSGVDQPRIIKRARFLFRFSHSSFIFSFHEKYKILEIQPTIVIFQNCMTRHQKHAKKKNENERKKFSSLFIRWTKLVIKIRKNNFNEDENELKNYYENYAKKMCRDCIFKKILFIKTK